MRARSSSALGRCRRGAPREEDEGAADLRETLRELDQAEERRKADLDQGKRDREAAVLYGWRPYMHNPSLAHWLHRVKVPSLVIWGEKDRIVAPAYGAHLTQRLQNARFVPIAAAGHYPQIEQPDAVAQAIAGFAQEI